MSTGNRTPQEQAAYNAWRQETATKAVADFRAGVKAAKDAEKGRRVIQRTPEGTLRVVYKKSDDYLPGSIVDPAVYE